MQSRPIVTASTVSLLFLALLTACGGPSDPECWSSGSCEGGSECRDGEDCDSGVCADSVCEPRCESSAECAAGLACVRDFSSTVPAVTTQICQAGCASGRIVDGASSGGLVCDGGAVRSCTEVSDPDVFCDVCGCAAAGAQCDAYAELRCDTLGSGMCACVQPQPVGAACTSHLECESRNCSGQSDSTGPRRCQPAAGTPCSGTECEFCNLPLGGGGVGCRQSCEGSSDCRGGLCLGFSDRMEYACYVECTDDSSICHVDERCDYVSGDSLGRLVCRPR